MAVISSRGRIVVTGADFSSRHIIAVGLVKHDGIIHERLETMQKAAGDENGVHALGAELYPNPLPICRGVGPHVHNHIIAGALDAANELGFLMRRSLCMKPPECAGFFVSGNVDAFEMGVNSVLTG
jgi:hypothetical protein